jgi:hypothetical protein
MPISRALKMTCGHALVLHLPLQVLLKRWTYFLSTSLTSFFLYSMGFPYGISRTRAGGYKEMSSIFDDL